VRLRFAFFKKSEFGGKKQLEKTMTTKEIAPGNNPQAEREILIHALRTATAKSRLITNQLESVGVMLRHRCVTTEQAMQELADEGILDLVEFKRPVSAR
jgi:hypothetical protein